MERDVVSTESIENAISIVMKELALQLNIKGDGSFVSSHEIDGVLDEEVHEFKKEVHANNINGIENELVDIAVAAIFGIACIKNKTVK